MMNMILTNKLTSGNSWSEEAPPDGFRQASTQSYGADFGARVLNVKINWLDLREALAYIVGYSSCLSTITGNAFDPTIPVTQGPYLLSRKNPARHPDMPNLRCTRVLSVQGRGSRVADGSNNPNAGAQPTFDINTDEQTGVFGQYLLAYLSLQFEIPKYAILEDNELNTAVTATAFAVIARTVVQSVTVLNGGSLYLSPPTVTFSPPPAGGMTATGFAVTSGARVTSITVTNPGFGYTEPPTITISNGGGRGAEYLRNCEFSSEIALETQSRKGQAWFFAQQSINIGGANYPLNQTQFPGERFLRTPKTVMKCRWTDVHADFVYLGRLIASNFEHRIGTVNSLPFPLQWYLDQNAYTGDDVIVQRQPGECLLLAPKITSHALVHPAVLAGEIGENYFPRGLDVEITWVCQGFPSIDTTTIDLSGNDHYGNPLNGSPTTLVRGHQLAPIVIPIQAPKTPGGPLMWWQWFVATTQTNLNALIAAKYTDIALFDPTNIAVQNLVLSINANLSTNQIAAAGAAVYAYILSLNPNPNPPLSVGLVIAQFRDSIANAVGGSSPINTDYSLLYPYSSHEQLFGSPESM